MFDIGETNMRMNKSYVPCLRWKQGEYQALYRLSSTARNLIIPVIEVAEIGFDFEKQENSKTIDEHLRDFATRVKGKWGKDECFVDMHLIEPTERMANGQHTTTFVFDDLRMKGVQAIPVIGVANDSQVRSSVYKTIKIDGRGLCMRINLEETAEPNLTDKVKTLLQECNVLAEQCDLILDLGVPNFEPLDGFAGLLDIIITNLPYLNKWRSFGLLGTSFPSSLSGINSGLSTISRNEWRLYKKLTKHLKTSHTRIPCFGDYAINNPEISMVDPRHMKPKANIRYTTSDNWLIARGQNVRDYGYSQHKELCNLVIDSGDYYGHPFSKGDKYIYDCAQGNVSTGNLTTWRWVGTNHHLEMVSRESAKFAASLDTPAL